MNKTRKKVIDQEIATKLNRKTTKIGVNISNQKQKTQKGYSNSKKKYAYR